MHFAFQKSREQMATTWGFLLQNATVSYPNHISASNFNALRKSLPFWLAAAITQT